MRGTRLVATLALVGVLAALVLPSAGVATPTPTYVTVSLTATGPSPRVVKLTVFSQQTLQFVNDDSTTHTVAFQGCVFDVAPGTADPVGCRSLGSVGTYRYSVDGMFTGSVHVVGLFRSVSLTARTHIVAPHHRLTLDGRVSYDNGGAPYCGSPNLIGVYARHSRSQLYKRIAVFTVKPRRGNPAAVENRCTFPFHLTVRPAIGTMYVARAGAELWQWRRATSRPFRVSIRR